MRGADSGTCPRTGACAAIVSRARWSVLEAVQSAQGTEHHLLDDVFGVVKRAEHAVAMDLERSAHQLDLAPSPGPGTGTCVSRS